MGARSTLLVLSVLAVVLAVVAIVVLTPPEASPDPARHIVPDDAPVRDGDVRESTGCRPWTEIVPSGPRWPPNEVGSVPILVYHAISDHEDRWTRHHDNFRADLERFYREGYRLVSLSDYVDGTIDIPAGFSPLVITFDDSSSGQFRYLESDDAPGGVIIDPNSAVGIMIDFHDRHPDFGLEATFFVNFPHPFRDAATWELKIATLVEIGMDIGNHTWTHAHLGEVSRDEARRQLALPVDAVRRVAGGYEVDILALPFGSFGPDIACLLEGEWEGIAYRNRAIMLAGGNPAPSPLDVGFDPLAIPRIQAIQSELDRWLDRLDGTVYVSCGCPSRITVPKARSGSVNPDVVGERDLVIYSRPD